MPKVELKYKNESFDSLLKRFKKSVDDDDLIREIRERQYYEKPSVIKKAKKDAQKRRAQMKRAQNNRPTKLGAKPR